MALLGCRAAAGAAQTTLTRDGVRPNPPAGATVVRRLPAGATVVGRLPAGVRLHVTVILKPRDPAALAAYAAAVSTPGTRSYRHYLTPAQFAVRFGAGPAQIARVRGALRRRGLRSGPSSAGHLSIPLTATAAALEHGLSISLRRLSLPGRRMAVAADAAPALSPAAARLVQSIVGLNTESAPRPLLVTPVRHDVGPALGPAPTVASAGPRPCARARAQASAQSGYTADQIASAYGFSGLYDAGDEGAGVTVAVYELEPSSPADIAAYQACYRTDASLRYVPVDGGAGHGTGSGEAALDIENLIGLAPQANVLVYQGPNSDSGSAGSGPYDTLSAIVNQDRAQVVTVSWGQCESQLGAGNAAAENTLFEQAAAEGQSIVAATGDSGAEDCFGAGTLPETQAAVDDPASQPYVIGVGGTTLGSLGPRPVESVWNSTSTVVSGLLQPGAGGGGISSLWPMPLSQLDASPSLNVLGAGVTSSRCGQPSGYCREVPDVSADGNPATGYLVYFNGGQRRPGQPAGWQTLGGTSGAAPVWAALVALADASTGCAGRPVGFAGPALYHAAGESYANDFNDVLTGNDDFTATNGAQFSAGPGYDEASGLGSPNATALAAGLCAATLRLVNPGAQRSTLHTSVALALDFSAPPAAALTLDVTGLPPGLSLNPATGRISGTPTRTGTFDVAITVRSDFGAATSIVFGWTIGAIPTVSGAAITGLGNDRPRLVLTIAAGPGAPPLAQLRVALPSRLSLTSAAGLKLSARATPRPRFIARLRHGALEIKLGRPLAELRIELAYPDLVVSTRRVAQARGRGHGPSQLRLRIVDTAAGATVLNAKLAAGG